MDSVLAVSAAGTSARVVRRAGRAWRRAPGRCQASSTPDGRV